VDWDEVDGVNQEAAWLQRQDEAYRNERSVIRNEDDVSERDEQE